MPNFGQSIYRVTILPGVSTSPEISLAAGTQCIALMLAATVSGLPQSEASVRPSFLIGGSWTQEDDMEIKTGVTGATFTKLVPPGASKVKFRCRAVGGQAVARVCARP